MLKHVHQTSSSGLSSPTGSMIGSSSQQSGSTNGSSMMMPSPPYRLHYRRKLPAKDTLSIDSSVSGMSSVDSSSPTPLYGCEHASPVHEPLSSRSSSSSSLHHEVASILRHIYNKSPPTVSISNPYGGIPI